MASEDEPQSLAEAEQLLNQHASIREDIDAYAEDYNKVRNLEVGVILVPGGTVMTGLYNCLS